MADYVSYAKAAGTLGISVATVRNWIKQGLLVSHDRALADSEVQALKLKIQSGEIKRLGNRANKTGSSRKFVPCEYANHTVELEEGASRILQTKNAGVQDILFILSINLFCKNNDITHGPLHTGSLNPAAWSFSRDGVKEICTGWFNDIGAGLCRLSVEEYRELLEYDFPVLNPNSDVLGGIYQSLIKEGKKSGGGSYYTPESLADEITLPYIKNGMKVLDPCCGTGRFLLCFSRKISDPQNIFGFDIDPVAVKIAAVNLLLAYTKIDFLPRVYCLDTLLLNRNHFEKTKGAYSYPEIVSKLIADEQGFDFVATNPPWGARYTADIKKRLVDNFPELSTSESFSRFIVQIYNMLKPDGIMSLILPESIAYVRTHQDIRRFILDNMHIVEITALGRRFSKVFSSAVHCVFQKQTNVPVPDSNRIHIKKPDESFYVQTGQFRTNRHMLLDIHISPRDRRIIDSVYAIPHTTLQGNAIWGLGIVTGDNSGRLIAINSNTVEHDQIKTVYTGKEVHPFRLSKPRFVTECPVENFQQAASIDLYRAPQKLVYRFIAKYPVVALDTSGAFTLNSANILIPQLEDLSLHTVLGLLNSKLFSYIYLKRFHAVKILRGDIETLPFIKLSTEEQKHIENIVKGIIECVESINTLDAYVFDLYCIAIDDREYILDCLKKS